MNTEYFVDRQSIVRRIWGQSDTILFIFAGAAGEFALNKAVDWLYFTGKLPADPLKRLFSTVNYARSIVFAERHAAFKVIDAMAAIHNQVEENRGQKIPDWAYRDVLFMLIDYSIRSFELLERKLSNTEKEEVFRVFNNVGNRMGIAGLPVCYNDWVIARNEHLEQHLLPSRYTHDLFQQYRKHLGFVRYRILVDAHKLVLPPIARSYLKLNRFALLSPLLSLYRLSRRLKLDGILKNIILPQKYKEQVFALDHHPHAV